MYEVEPPGPGLGAKGEARPGDIFDAVLHPMYAVPAQGNAPGHRSGDIPTTNLVGG